MPELQQLVYRAYIGAYNHGFWKDVDTDNPLHLLAKLMLITTEVSEAAEAVRNNTSNLGEELADIIIRTMDLMGALDLDVESLVLGKMYYNEQRGYMHGKRA